MKNRLLYLITLIVITILVSGGAHGRGKIHIVGSPDLLRFVQHAAEDFALHTGNSTPIIEFSGTGSGLKLLCGGIGFEHPDISVSLRSMTSKELSRCHQNGVADVVEIIVGLDGMVLVNNTDAQQYDFSTEDLFLALSKYHVRENKRIANPYDMWVDISPLLPIHRIRIMGPKPGSVIEQLLINRLILEPCQEKAKALLNGIPSCQSIRSDDVFIQSPKREGLLIDFLANNPIAFGFTRYSHLALNHKVVAANAVNGVTPTPETLSNGNYPLIQPLYFYLKASHVAAIKGLQQFLYEITSERAIGPDGYLRDSGYVPLDDIGRNRARDQVLGLPPIQK